MIPTRTRGYADVAETAVRIAIIIGFACVFAVIGALVHVWTDTGNDSWNTAAVANEILAKHPTGCPPPPQRRIHRAEPFAGPIRARIVNADGVPCEKLMGQFAGDPPPDTYIQPINGTTDTLQVQIDNPVAPKSSWLPVFVVCFVAALSTGLAALFWPRMTHNPATGSASAAGPPPPSPTGPQYRSSIADEHSTTDSRPVAEAARRVELAALTTSGVSGLTVDRGSSGPFDVYAATQVGLQHAKTGHTREDAYAIGGAPDRGWVFLAVADGLGSAANSHAAAQRATQSALTFMHEHVPQIAPRNAEAEWKVLAREITAKVADRLDTDEINRLAAQIGYLPSKSSDAKRSSIPSCTLIFAALGPVSPNGYPVLWGSVGDCELLFVNLDSGAMNWATHNATKQLGGPVSNVTAAMPRDYPSVISSFEFVPPNTMTVIASDGMADAIRQEPQQFSALLPQVAGPSPREHVFGEIVGFQLPGLHDDRTIVAAWPRGSAHPAERRVDANTGR